MQLTEYPHNTREQVEQYLADALEIAAKLDPPADLAGITFAKAVDLLSSKQVVMEQMPSVARLDGLRQQ